MIAPIVILALIVVFILTKSIYSLLMTIFLLSPISLLFLSALPGIQFLSLSKMMVYIIVGLHPLLVGLLAAFMFNKVSETFGKYIGSGIVLSSVLALSFSILKLLETLILKLTAQLSALGTAVGGLSTIVSLLPDPINSNFGFVIALCTFNLTYFIYYFKRKDKKPIYFLEYIIPIVIFILGSYLIQLFLSRIISPVNMF